MFTEGSHLLSFRLQRCKHVALEPRRHNMIQFCRNSWPFVFGGLPLITKTHPWKSAFLSPVVGRRERLVCACDGSAGATRCTVVPPRGSAAERVEGSGVLPVWLRARPSSVRGIRSGRGAAHLGHYRVAHALGIGPAGDVTTPCRILLAGRAFRQPCRLSVRCLVSFLEAHSCPKPAHATETLRSVASPAMPPQGGKCLSSIVRSSRVRSRLTLSKRLPVSRGPKALLRCSSLLWTAPLWRHGTSCCWVL